MNNIVLMIVLPILTAFLLPVVNRVSEFAGRYIGQVVLVLTSLIGISLWSQAGDAPFALQIGGFSPLLGISLYVDQLAIVLAVAMSVGALLLWPTAEQATIKQSTLYMLLAGSGSGLALSGDLFNLYVFYELVAVASYGLIAARGSAASLAATMRYLIISGVGAAMALAGIALVYQATDTLNLALIAQLAPEKLDNAQGLAAFALLLLGFGVKAELFPVNTWVPEVYATASSRISALLAGVVSKLALVLIVRLLVLIFNQPEALQLMLVLGIAGAISGELAAWRATDINRMLAYSSIGQLGVMFIAFSIPGPLGIYAGLAVAIHHMIVKPAFFMLASNRGGRRENLSGLARVSPLWAAVFVLLSLTLVGVPPFPGFWAKMLVVMSLFQQAGSLYWLGAGVILAGAVLEVSYMFKIAISLYQPPKAEQDAAASIAAPASRDLTIAAGLGVLLVLGMVFIGPLSERLKIMANQTADVSLYIKTVGSEELR